MAFFEDLTPYNYFLPEREGTVNIGWLERGHPFSAGPTSATFREKLKACCHRRVKQTRGLHMCEFCKGRKKPGGSAEIRVVGNGRVYAAPELVYHYVVVHDYKPPKEFIGAVLASGRKRRTKPRWKRGDLVEFDGLLAVVVGVEGDPQVPDDHIALWFGTPQVKRKSRGGQGGHQPEVWLVPEECAIMAAAPVYKH